MKRFALVVIISCLLFFCSSCFEIKHDVENEKKDISSQTAKEGENCFFGDDDVVLQESLFKEGDYKSVNGILSIYNVGSKGFYFKIKLYDKSDSNNNKGSIGFDSEKTFAKYKKNDKAVLRGIDTDNTEDEDYNIIFSYENDCIVITEMRNDGSDDVINPYSKLGIKFSGKYKK